MTASSIAAPIAPPTASVDVPAATTAISAVDFSSLVETLSPSVVGVLAVVPGPDPSSQRTGIGSGLIVGDGNEVLTNQHVVAQATKLTVAFADQHTVDATLVAADARVDLALLRLGSYSPTRPAVTFADPPPRPGQPIMAIGQPFGLGNTVTAGIISGLARDYDDLGQPQALDPDGFWSFVQTDASINIGNSGGPLVDVAGHVVGVTTAVRLDGQGLAFAIPAAMAQHFLDEVHQHGKLRHVRLGMRAADVGIEVEPSRVSTVRITAVEPQSPAAAAGLAVGDYILQVDSKPIGRVSQLAYLAQLAGVGDTIALQIQRGDSPPHTVELELAEGG